MLGNLMYQTRPPDETIVLVSGLSPALVAGLREHFPAVSFHERPDLQDWGHAKRAEGLALARKDWVGFFNDDDSYAVDYLEKMLAAGTDLVDAVFCAWNRIPGCHFGLGSSTSGNFIVRRELAQKVTYPTRRYEADGDFIEALNRAGARSVKVDEILYHHNHQP